LEKLKEVIMDSIRMEEQQVRGKLKSRIKIYFS